MARRKSRAASATEPPKSVKFHYLKGGGFQTIHVDGAIGGPTPNGNVNIAFYSERFPIPQQVTVEVERGVLKNELPSSRVVRDGIIRELQFDAIMHVETARTLIDWLKLQVEKIDKASKTAGSE